MDKIAALNHRLWQAERALHDWPSDKNMDQVFFLRRALNKAKNPDKPAHTLIWPQPSGLLKLHLINIACFKPELYNITHMTIKPTEFKIALTLEYLQSLLDIGERVIISPNGIDTELHDENEPAECLLNAHEYVAGLMLELQEKQEAEVAVVK